MQAERKDVKWDFSGTEETDLDRSSVEAGSDASIGAMTAATGATIVGMTGRTVVMTAGTAAVCSVVAESV